MPTDATPAAPEKTQLAEYQVWDRVERRLWSRARVLFLFVVVLVLVAGVLGAPLVEERVEKRVNDRVERLVAERLALVKVDVPALRQEIREETQFQKEQLLGAQLELEKRVASLVKESQEVEGLTAALRESVKEYETVKGQIRLIQQTVSNEEERLHKLRTTHEKELTEFRQEAEQLSTDVRKLSSRELAYVEHVVDRDLDELRLIVADYLAGGPAIFSTYLDLEERTGQITGLNFGGERGNVFLRVRAFTAGAEKPFSESDSILVQTTLWDDSRIHLRIPAPAMEKIQEAQLTASRSKASPPEFRFGFLIQSAEGKMSQWSALRADSIIPPTRSRPRED